MTLLELRKMEKRTRASMADLLQCSIMKIRRIEEKDIKDLTFRDLEAFATGMQMEVDDILNFLIGPNFPSTALKAVFWCFNVNGTINAAETWRKIEHVSNKPNITSLQNYAYSKNKFDSIKINWCYYKITGEELCGKQ